MGSKTSVPAPRACLGGTAGLSPDAIDRLRWLPYALVAEDEWDDAARRSAWTKVQADVFAFTEGCPAAQEPLAVAIIVLACPEAYLEHSYRLYIARNPELNLPQGRAHFDAVVRRGIVPRLRAVWRTDAAALAKALDYALIRDAPSRVPHQRAVAAHAHWSSPYNGALFDSEPLWQAALDGIRPDATEFADVHPDVRGAERIILACLVAYWCPHSGMRERTLRRLLGDRALRS